MLPIFSIWIGSFHFSFENETCKHTRNSSTVSDETIFGVCSTLSMFARSKWGMQFKAMHIWKIFLVRIKNPSSVKYDIREEREALSFSTSIGVFWFSQNYCFLFDCLIVTSCCYSKTTFNAENQLYVWNLMHKHVQHYFICWITDNVVE